jgi:hypothetical protein
MIDICRLISSLITEEVKVWPMSIRGEVDDDGSCLVQNMALLLKGDEIQQTSLGYVFKNWNQSCENIGEENMFIGLQIPCLHVKLQGKLHMYKQLHVIVVYEKRPHYTGHKASMRLSVVMGWVDRQSQQPRDVTCQSKKYMTAYVYMIFLYFFISC